MLLWVEVSGVIVGEGGVELLEFRNGHFALDQEAGLFQGGGGRWDGVEEHPREGGREVAGLNANGL